MNQLQNDIISILKNYFLKSGTSTFPNIDEIKIILSSFQDNEIILKRYSKIIMKNNGFVGNDLLKSSKVYFKCRIQPTWEVDTEEIKEYCLETKTEFIGDYSWRLSISNNVRKYISEKIYEKLKKEIPKIENTKYSNEFKIPKESSIMFFEKFKNSKHIDWGWSGLSAEPNFAWNEKILDSGKELWDWEILQANKGIDWNFELINKYKDILNWAYISSYELEWSIDWIKKFKDYLVFEGDYGMALPNKFRRSNRGKWFHKYSESENVVGNISANESNFWSTQLIDAFIKKWDWKLLSKNNGINWNYELVKKYENFIDFKSFSSNNKMKWDLKILTEYQDYFDFNSLVCNKSILWSKELIETFSDKINFTELSKHGNLSENAIISNKEKWKQGDTQRHYARRISDGSYYYYTNHNLWEYLTKNKNIIWTDFLIKNCIENISLQNLNSDNVKIKVSTLNKYWDYKKNELTSYWENYDGRPSSTYHDIYFREKVKDCEIIDLDLEKFKENEIKWWGVLNSENFLNKTIIELIKTVPNTV